MLLVHGQLFRDRFPTAGPDDFNGDRSLVLAEAEVEAGVVLVAFARAGFDVAGEGAVAEACTPTFPGPSASRKPRLRKQFTSSRLLFPDAQEE